jgi:hypothetical protein
MCFSTNVVAKEEIPLILLKNFNEDVLEIKKNNTTHIQKLIMLFVTRIFFDKLYTWLVKNIDNEIRATAAQLALALTRQKVREEKMIVKILLRNYI